MADKKLQRLLKGLLSDVPVDDLQGTPPDAVDPGEGRDSVSRLERRAMHLQTASRVSRAASSILSLDELLPQVANLIQEQFDLYYAGIFLIEQVGGVAGEWAVLQAGTGQAGRQMMEQRHRLQVGGESMVGWCIAHQRARIALDVGAEAVRFDNPLLPRTRSEVALPLVSRGQVIGAMTFHSSRAADFSDEDISVLQNMADQLANAIENARLFEDHERQIAQLSIVNEIGQAVSSIQDLDLLLETVYQQVGRLFDMTNFYIATYEETAGEWVLALAFEHGERQPVSRYQASAGLTGYILHTRRPLLLRTTAEMEELHRTEGIQFLGEQAMSWLGVPLIAAGQVVGVMAIQDYAQEHQYGDQDVRLFVTIAAQIAKALENVRLFESARLRAEEQAMLLRVTEAVNRSLEMQDLLETTLEAVIDWIGFDAGLFSLQDPKTGQLVLAAHQGVPESMVQNLQRDGLGSTLCEAVFLQEEKMGICDLSLQAPVDVSGLVDLGWHSYAGVPLMYKGGCLGTLCCFGHTAREVRDWELGLLESAARQIGIGVVNVRLLAETRDSAALLTIRINQLDCLNDIGRKIDEVPPVPEFLEWVAGRVPSAMQYSDLCRVAIQFEGQVYGAKEAMDLPDQIVQNMRLGGERVGRVCVAYTDRRDFLNEESAFLGDIARRTNGYIENRRLFEQTEEALDEAAMLYRVAQSLGQIADEREMFAFVLSEYLGSLALDQGGVLIFDEDRQYGTLEALMVDGKPAQPGLRIPVQGNPACEKLIATREPVAIVDALHDQLLGPVQSLTQQLGYKSMLLVPISIGSRIVGALGADSVAEIYEFSSRDIALVRAVADQLGIAMENRRLIRETQAALAEVEATHHRYLRRTWQDHLRQRELLQRSAFLLDRTGPEEEEVWSASPDLWQPEIEPAGQEGHHIGGNGSGDQASPALAIPITLRGQTIGVLGVESPAGDRPWTEEDVALVEAISDQLAQTLETARLFADTQRRAERERLIGEITTKIRATTDMRDILEMAATELGQALGASRALVRLGVGGGDAPQQEDPVLAEAPPAGRSLFEIEPTGAEDG